MQEFQRVSLSRTLQTSGKVTVTHQILWASHEDHVNQPKFTQMHHKPLWAVGWFAFKLLLSPTFWKNHASVSISDAVGTTPPCDVVSVAWLNKEKPVYGISCSPTWKSQTSFGNTRFSTLRLLVSVFVHSSKQKVSAPLYWNGFPLFGERSSSSIVLKEKPCISCHLWTVALDDYCYHWRPCPKGKYQTQKHCFTVLILLKKLK